MTKCKNCKKEVEKEENKRSSKFYCNEICHIKKLISISKEGCWNGNQKPRPDGYLNFFYKGRTQLLHRVSWQVFKGDIPKDKILCHTCDNRLCCNPDHLYLGDHSTNAVDRQKRNCTTAQIGSKNHNSKLCEDKVKFIRFMEKNGFCMDSIADFFGISRPYIKDIINKRRWSHI